MGRNVRRVRSTLAAIGVLVVACAGPAGTPVSSIPPPVATSPSATAARTLVPTPSATASPIPTWPSVGEPPVPDAPGTLLLMHVQWGDEGGRVPLLVVLADGRVVTIHRTQSEEASYLVKRRLTTAGIDAVRTALTDVGLFDRDRKRQMIEPWPAGGAGDQLRVRLGQTTVTVSRNLAPAEYYEPSASWDRFDALVEALRAPDRWLAEDSWADTRWTPYHAPAFCLRLYRESAPDTLALDSADLDLPETTRPFRSFGTESINEGERFGPIEAADAYRLAASIASLASAKAVPYGGSSIGLEAGGASFGYSRIRDGNVDWVLVAEALMPLWQCVDR